MIASRKTLSELLRPQQLADITLPARDIARLREMIETRNIMNMVFYGRPGLGKTSAALIIAEQSGLTWVRFHGSEFKSGDVFRARVESFATSMSFDGGRKVCVIDDAEFLPPKALGSLRDIIENGWQNCRFIMTANDLSKIPHPIRSRLLSVCFDISAADKPDVLARWRPSYERRLTELGVPWERQRLHEIIGTFFADLRQIANKVEYEFGGGQLPSPVCVDSLLTTSSDAGGL